MILGTVGIVILAAVGLWFFGGVFLRVGGIILALVGAISLITTGQLFALFVAALGLVIWLAGHWHFAVRHHEYKSPLAERIFLQLLPARLDPTRNWGTPVIPAEPPRSSPRRPPDGGGS